MVFSTVSRDYNNAINGHYEPPPVYTFTQTYATPYTNNAYEEIGQPTYSTSSVPSAPIYSSHQPIYSSHQPPLSAQSASTMPDLASNPTYSTSSPESSTAHVKDVSTADKNDNKNSS